MLEYNRTDSSEEIDINKTNPSLIYGIIGIFRCFKNHIFAMVIMI